MDATTIVASAGATAGRSMPPCSLARARLGVVLGVALLGAAMFACSGDAARPESSAPSPAAAREERASDTAPAPEGARRSAACGDGDDIVLDALCGDAKPTSLLELRERLGLGASEDGAPLLGTITSTTSLAVRTVSEANPRVILHGLDTTDRDRPRAVFLAFARGSAVVELAAADRRTNELTFYLVGFEPRSGSGALFLPSVERDWSNVTLTRDEDLEDTAFDCLGCHRPGGPGTKKRLLFREGQHPFLHWMGATPMTGATSCGPPQDCVAEWARREREAEEYRRRDPGLAVAEAFRSVHPADDSYASVSVRELTGQTLHYGVTGPLEANGWTWRDGSLFPAAEIFAEVKAAAGQPFVNVPVGSSPTWDAARAASLRERAAMPFPYHDAKATDPARLARYAEAYQAIARGAAAPDTLPDARDLLLPEARRALLIDMDPGVSGDDVLARACSQCHNEGVRPGLRRAAFDARNPDRASRAVKDAAIARMRLPADDPRRMPPAVFRDLDDASRDAAIARLER